MGECFQKWGFKRDPFSESYGYPFWAMPTRDIELLKFLLKGIADQDGVLNILIRGEYGSGKTYTLRTLENYVKNELKGIALYFQIQPKSQTKGFVDIHKEIIREIGPEPIVQIGKRIVETEKLADQNKFEAFFSDRISSRDLIQALYNLIYNREFAMTWAWLMGETTIYQQRSLQMESSPKDESASLGILTGMIDYLLLEYPIVAICIDEMENLTGFSRPILSIREGIRNLYDRLIYDEKRTKVAIISSVTAELIYQTTTTMGKPLLDRLDREVEMKPLDEGDAGAFVTKLFQQAKDSLENPLVPPFKNDDACASFLNFAKTASLIPGLGRPGILTPRRVIKAGKYLLQEACFDKKNVIDSEFIKGLLQRA